jgi:hypothetical protein
MNTNRMPVRDRPASFSILVAAGVLLLTGACGELKTLPTQPEELPDPTATFTRVQSEIFTPSCALGGCHDAAGQQQGLVLSAGSAYAMTVGSRSTELPSLDRVAPGAPDASYLYRKVAGVSITGERMPYGGPYLADAQMNLIRNWILRGAPND